MKYESTGKCSVYGELKPFKESDLVKYKHTDKQVVQCHQCLKYHCRVEVVEVK